MDKWGCAICHETISISQMCCSECLTKRDFKTSPVLDRKGRVLPHSLINTMLKYSNEKNSVRMEQ